MIQWKNNNYVKKEVTQCALNSNKALIFTAALLLNLFFSNLSHPLKLKAIYMTPIHQCQCFEVYLDLCFHFQVYFDSPMYICSTSMKDHTLLVVIMQFDASRWFSTSIYTKWLPLKLTWTQKSYSHIEHEDSGRKVGL